MSWVLSYDVYEALDALAPGQTRYVNGVHVRRANAALGADKLFEVDRIRGVCTERFLPFADAVRFVLNPPPLENPFAHLRALRPYAPFVEEPDDAAWREKFRAAVQVVQELAPYAHLQMPGVLRLDSGPTASRSSRRRLGPPRGQLELFNDQEAP